MKTIEVLDKYRKIISGILDCKPEDIEFHVSEDISNRKHRLVGERLYVKDSYCYLGKYLVTQKIDNKDSFIARFTLYQLPHCCAFMVSCDSYIELEHRNKGIGKVLNQLRQDIGRLLGYSSIICTDIEQNTNQRKLLKTNGWKDVHSVVNKRTKNKVYLSVINI